MLKFWLNQLVKACVPTEFQDNHFEKLIRHLSPNETALFKKLIEKRYLDRDALYEILWSNPDNIPDGHTEAIRAAISRIRKKIKTAGLSANIQINNLHGEGIYLQRPEDSPFFNLKVIEHAGLVIACQPDGAMLASQTGMIKITKPEIGILECLLDSSPRFVKAKVVQSTAKDRASWNREHLSDDIGATHTASAKTYISKLRKALAKIQSGWVIENSCSMGYRLMLPSGVDA